MEIPKKIFRVPLGFITYQITKRVVEKIQPLVPELLIADWRCLML